MKKSIYALAVGAFGIITTEFGIIGILPQLADHFAISIEKAGILLSGFSVVIALFGPGMTLLTSGINRKRMMLFVMVLFAISNVLSAWAPSFTLEVVARILPAFFHPVFWSVALVTAANAVPKEQATRATALVWTGLSAATVLGVPITTYLADSLGWQASFYFNSIISLIAFAGIYAFVPSMPIAERPSFGTQLGILRKRMFWLNQAIHMFIFAALFASYGYMAEFLSKVTGMDGSTISIMLMLFGAAGVAGNLVMGRLINSGVERITFYFLGAMATTFMIIYLTGSWPFAMMAAVLVWGFVHTSSFLITQVRVSSTAQEAPEFGNSLYVSFGNLGVTLGTAIGGFAISHFGIESILLASISLLAIGTSLTLLHTVMKQKTQVIKLNLRGEIKKAA